MRKRIKSENEIQHHRESMLTRFGLPFIGKTYGRLTILSVDMRDGTGNIWATCKCDCGKQKIARLPAIKAGQCLSCGCARRLLPADAIVLELFETGLSAEQIAHKFGLVGGASVRKILYQAGIKLPPVGSWKKHGGWATAEYKAWCSMLRRCHPRHPAGYYARGLRVCKEWQQDFVAFLAHIGPKPTPKHSVDRIKNHLGYYPGNVRWATQTEQMRNTRSNVLLTACGETLPLVVWAERLGMRGNSIANRLKRGWTPEMAVSTKPGNKHHIKRRYKNGRND